MASSMASFMAASATTTATTTAATNAATNATTSSNNEHEVYTKIINLVKTVLQHEPFLLVHLTTLLQQYRANTSTSTSNTSTSTASTNPSIITFNHSISQQALPVWLWLGFLPEQQQPSHLTTHPSPLHSTTHPSSLSLPSHPSASTSSTASTSSLLPTTWIIPPSFTTIRITQMTYFIQLCLYMIQNMSIHTARVQYCLAMLRVVLHALELHVDQVVEHHSSSNTSTITTTLPKLSRSLSIITGISLSNLAQGLTFDCLAADIDDSKDSVDPYLANISHSTFTLPFYFLESDDIVHAGEVDAHIKKRYTTSQSLRYQLSRHLIAQSVLSHPDFQKQIYGWKSVTPLLPVHTIGDGDCLLHSLSICLFGVADRASLLKQLLYFAICDYNPFSAAYFKEKWSTQCAFDYAIQGTDVEIVNSLGTDEEWSRIVNDCKPNFGACKNNFLGQVHVFVLANVLRRPIMVLGPHILPDAGENYIRGIYLPLRTHPDLCCKEPLTIWFDGGHYTALVPIESTYPTPGMIPIDHFVPDGMSMQRLCIRFAHDVTPGLALESYLKTRMIRLFSSLNSSQKLHVMCVDLRQRKPLHDRDFASLFSQAQSEQHAARLSTIPLPASVNTLLEHCASSADASSSSASSSSATSPPLCHLSTLLTVPERKINIPRGIPNDNALSAVKYAAPSAALAIEAIFPGLFDQFRRYVESQSASSSAAQPRSSFWQASWSSEYSQPAAYHAPPPPPQYSDDAEDDELARVLALSLQTR